MSKRAALVHPKDFIQTWQCSASELADLLSVTPSTVRRWLADGASSSAAPADILSRLDELHVRLLQWELDDRLLPQLRRFYELVNDRKSDL